MTESIRALRKHAGLTQKELAERVGTSQVVISGWENGHHLPNGTYMLKLGEVLGIDPREIAFGGAARAATETAMRDVLQNQLEDPRSHGIWRTDAGIYIMPLRRSLQRAMAGYRRSFETYVTTHGEEVAAPLGSDRRGVQLHKVFLIRSQELPA